MKNFTRAYPLFSLCGLNCGLCTMHLGGHCPGCGGGKGNQSCSIARCSMEKGVEFCSLCADYPCDKLEQYNDGRHKSSFCTAVNLLTLTSLRQIMVQCAVDVTPEMTPKERAGPATAKLNTAATQQGISLKMRKKK